MKTRLLIAGSLALIASLIIAGSALAAARYTVTTTADDTGSTNNDTLCTLREAVSASNGTPGITDCPGASASENQIDFSPSLGANPVINLTAFGDLNFGTNDVTINGPATVNGHTNFRVITSNAITLTLNQLTISNGSDNTGQGGGILMIGGRLFVNNSTISGNSTTKTSTNASAQGGGIQSSGPVTLTNSTVSNNQVVANCTGCIGSATSVGGGIHISGDQLTMENSVVSGNQAVASSDGASGGAEGAGGGVRTDGDVLIVRSTISGNLASATGPAGAQPVAQGGGAVFHGSSSNGADVELSTIANNSVKAVGATSPLARAGGIADTFLDTDDSFVSDTIAGNGLDPGSATANVQGLNFYSASTGTGSRTFYNSIIANPVGSTGDNCLVDVLLTDTGPNLEFPVSVSSPCFDATHTNVLHSDPQLGALGPNGGPTPTMLPAATSPVIDKGSAANQKDINGDPDTTHDQRGLVRPVVFSGLTHLLDGSDIGSVEVQATCTGQPTPGGACPSGGGGGGNPSPTPPKKKKCKKKKAKKGAVVAKKKCKKKKG
jgi:CSLREA domain-containing protein